MLHRVLPLKKHPEDTNIWFAWLAKAVLVCGVLCLPWTTYYLAQWARSMAFKETTGRVQFGALHYVKTNVTNVSFDYVVSGKTYTSQNIAIGGRPLGYVPGEGFVTVYYNLNDPNEAVLLRRPAEVIILGFVFSLLSPFLAGLIWRKYA